MHYITCAVKWQKHKHMYQNVSVWLHLLKTFGSGQITDGPSIQKRPAEFLTPYLPPSFRFSLVEKKCKSAS